MSGGTGLPAPHLTVMPTELRLRVIGVVVGHILHNEFSPGFMEREEVDERMVKYLGVNLEEAMQLIDCSVIDFFKQYFAEFLVIPDPPGFTKKASAKPPDSIDFFVTRQKIEAIEPAQRSLNSAPVSAHARTDPKVTKDVLKKTTTGRPVIAPGSVSGEDDYATPSGSPFYVNLEIAREATPVPVVDEEDTSNKENSVGNAVVNYLNLPMLEVDFDLIEPPQANAATLEKNKQKKDEIAANLKKIQGQENGAKAADTAAKEAEKKKADEAIAKKKQEDEKKALESKRQMEEAAAAKKRKEEEEKKKAEETARKKREEEEVKRKQAEEAAAAKKKEDDQKKKTAEDKRKAEELAAAEKKKRDDEEKRNAEAAKKKKEEEELKRKLAEDKKKAEEAAAKKKKEDDDRKWAEQAMNEADSADDLLKCVAAPCVKKTPSSVSSQRSEKTASTARIGDVKEIEMDEIAFLLENSEVTPASERNLPAFSNGVDKSDLRASTPVDNGVNHVQYKVDRLGNVRNYDLAYPGKHQVADSVEPAPQSHLLNLWSYKMEYFPELVLLFQYIYPFSKYGEFDLITYQGLLAAVGDYETIFYSCLRFAKEVDLMFQLKFISFVETSDKQLIRINTEVLKLQMIPLAKGMPSALMYLLLHKSGNHEMQVREIQTWFTCDDETFFTELITELNNRPDLYILDNQAGNTDILRMTVVLNKSICTKFVVLDYMLYDSRCAKDLHLGKNPLVDDVSQFE